MPGETISHYRILEKLGEGGMGEVYLAQDMRLQRRVALKFLAPDLARDREALVRFRSEALATAELSHPNIATVYDFDEADGCSFLVLEYLQGQTLKDRIAAGLLPIEDVLRIGEAMASGLAEAHAHGIVHRDIKSANIVLTEKGEVKILDFGLAHRADATQLTRPGSTLGTIAYMSPEQARGRATDERSDLWSLGAVLYECLTGSPPFTGEGRAVIEQILSAEPTPPTAVRAGVPMELEQIVLRCLEKDATLRYQHADDLLAHLRRARRGDAPRHVETPTFQIPNEPERRRPRAAWVALLIPMIAIIGWWVVSRDGPRSQLAEGPIMIAVLPFENLGSPENEYFAAGITEEITSRLAAVEGLGVISRTSAIQYEGTTKSLQEIGDELGVDYLLEGTVRWARDAEERELVRITPQLIHVEDDLHVWADRYDDVLDDVFGVQSAIAQSVVRQLGVTLLRPAREMLERKPTEDLAAYEAYLRGRNAGDITQAIDFLERAVALDPSFSEAWAVLANQHAYLHRFGMDRTAERLAAADSTLARAIALAPENPEVLRAAGYVRYYAHDDYEGALVTFERLLGLNPSSAAAYEGMAYIRRRQGRLDEAVSLLENAHRLDPRRANIVFNLARTWEAEREFAVAGPLYEKAVGLDPDDCGYYSRWGLLILEQGGGIEEATRIAFRCPGAQERPVGMQLGYMAGDYDTVLDGTERLLRRGLPPAGAGVMHSVRAFALRKQGRDALAEAEAVIALDLLREAASEQSPSYDALCFLALNLALFGSPEEAILVAQSAVELSAIDRFEGPRTELFLAAIYLHAGRSAEAIAILDRMLTTPYDQPLTPPLLRVHWLFQEFQEVPEIQELLRRHTEVGT